LAYLREGECAGAGIRIDKNTLKERGALALYIEKDGIKVESAKAKQGVRPWVP
jgi:hypothetical protein